MIRRRRKYTASRTSPTDTRRGCLCADGKTYSSECCDGSLQAQGIGPVTMGAVDSAGTITSEDTTSTVGSTSTSLPSQGSSNIISEDTTAVIIGGDPVTTTTTTTTTLAPSTTTTTTTAATTTTTTTAAPTTTTTTTEAPTTTTTTTEAPTTTTTTTEATTTTTTTEATTTTTTTEAPTTTTTTTMAPSGTVQSFYAQYGVYHSQASISCANATNTTTLLYHDNLGSGTDLPDPLPNLGDTVYTTYTNGVLSNPIITFSNYFGVATTNGGTNVAAVKTNNYGVVIDVVSCT